MQAAFSARLVVRVDNQDGYERTERFRQMVQDVLTLAQGFVDIACIRWSKMSCKGTLESPTNSSKPKDGSHCTSASFHGWHGDAWYDQTKVQERIPREVKLGFYLTDVQVFPVIVGTNGKQAATIFRQARISQLIAGPGDRDARAGRGQRSCSTLPEPIGRLLQFSKSGRRSSSTITIPRSPCKKRTSITIVTTRYCSTPPSLAAFPRMTAGSSVLATR